MAGRLAAYLVFALAVSLVSVRFSGAVPGWILALGILLSGILMLLYAVVKNVPQWSFCAPLSQGLKAARLPFLLGFLVGINVCPPFTAGLIRLLTLKDVGAGLSYFVAFFAGTTLYMLPLMAAGPLARFQRLQAVAAIASGLSGFWFIGLGLSRLF